MVTEPSTTKAGAPTRALLACVGELLFGPCWQSALAHALGVSPRTMRYWLADRAIPAGVRGDLVALLRDRIGELETALRMLHLG